MPNAFWHAFFVQGHGIWTDLENAVVGPFIALISFVCFIATSPLAAALWQGGISFGAVISFIFADLMALPLVLIYRKFYRGALAIRMLAVFWAVMAAAGLVTQLIFGWAGLIPAHRPAQIVPDRLTLDYTTVLNIVFRLLFAMLYVLYLNRERLGGGTRYAIDPVCGMQVEKTSAPAKAVTGGRTFWFCSDRCRDRFMQNPARQDLPLADFGPVSAKPTSRPHPSALAPIPRSSPRTAPHCALSPHLARIGWGRKPQIGALND